MTGVSPGYGETPLPHEELDALLPAVVKALESPVTRAAVYDLEQAIQLEVAEELLAAAFDGSLPVADLLRDHFIRALHRRLYGDIWTWGGQWRQTDVNIGVPRTQITIELRSALDNIRYRWENTNDWTARELGMAVHAETVRVHPFTDGNGRATRLLADLVYIAAQDPAQFHYDWDLDKKQYITLLRRFDEHRDVHELATFIAVAPIE